MADKGEKNDKHWVEAHDKLLVSMQKEIGIMRELLANMHQEELSLLLHDTKTWNQVMQERSQLVERLGHFRFDRLEATKTIEDIAKLNTNKKGVTLEQILPQEDENSCEILSLRDQIIALSERINFQNTRNETLFHQTSRSNEIPSSNSTPQPMPNSQKPKKKASIATYYFKQ